MEDEQWKSYYNATTGREPRELLLQALSYINPDLPKDAIDVGYGAGNEVVYLLKQGWTVTAIDQEEEAAKIIKARAPNPDHLTVLTQPYHDVKFPKVSLIHAGFSLPFSSKPEFTEVWSELTQSLHPAGIFCGQLFGKNDAWSERKTMTFHSLDEIRALFQKFKIIEMEEIEGERKTATGGMKYWHFYNIIAQKNASD